MLPRLLSLSFLLVVTVLTLDAADSKPSLATLFGRMHVVMVHFPVALLMVMAVIEVLRWRRREGSCDATVVWMAVIAAVSSMLAVFQGYILAGDRSEDVLELHRWLGISTAIVAVVIALVAIARQFGDRRGLAKLYRYTVLPGAVLVSLTGHYGGVLMHGKDYLPIMPWELWHYFFGEPEAPVGSVGKLPDKVDFWRDIDPIFVESCYECHNDKEQKAELRMDTREFLLKGGDSGPAIIPGNGKKSLLYIRLFEGEDDPRMPKKKPALSPYQIAVIEKWIDQGAEWPAKPAQ